ncbi:class I SAM-dependent methyltransferase [Ornithinimicrobium cavernae]|uniref:class I SAM-dependent methyltransferase n=1 Tax=Ornithinimicrobium cavernae TaxID=2666047 RepID=UPI000D69A6A9|nr:class I SAM-dependent methyltransferase [Ornithinimicrobium cavernae]
MPDSVFDDPRLAPLYDILDPDRSDLDTYLAIADEIGARSVLDVGCGTGTLGILLAERGIEVTGVDPAGASLDVARSKPYAERVTWIHGDATTLPPLQVDLATMTANVAQVFLTDEDWAATLAGVYAALRPGGHLVFETRVPAVRAWEGWTPERTRATTDVPGLGPVTEWMEVTDVREDPLLVSFTAHNEFPDGEDVVSTSTLRFRSREELDASLGRAGFDVREVRDAPDRPGREWVYLAHRPLSTA